MKDEPARRQMAETAYHDIVASQQYTYRSMVEKVLYESINVHQAAANEAFHVSLLILVNKAHIVVNIVFLYLFSRVRDIRNKFFG